MALGAILGAVIPSLSSIFGGASKAKQDQQNKEADRALAWEQLRLQAPGQRADTALRAALSKNFSPQSVSWGGPGSGLRGELPQYSGGLSSSMTQSQQDPMLQQMLQDAIAGKAPESYDRQQYPKSSKWDKLLGGLSLGTSIAGVGTSTRR